MRHREPVTRQTRPACAHRHGSLRHFGRGFTRHDLAQGAPTGSALQKRKGRRSKKGQADQGSPSNPNQKIGTKSADVLKSLPLRSKAFCIACFHMDTLHGMAKRTGGRALRVWTISGSPLASSSSRSKSWRLMSIFDCVGCV